MDASPWLLGWHGHLGIHLTKRYWEYAFLVANDLLDNNGCLVFLQSFGDAFTIDFFFFARGSKVYILAKKYTCINNILMHTKSKRYYVIQVNFIHFFHYVLINIRMLKGISSGLMWFICGRLCFCMQMSSPSLGDPSNFMNQPTCKSNWFGCNL
jgi:hypothetical protein